MNLPVLFFFLFYKKKSLFKNNLNQRGIGLCAYSTLLGSYKYMFEYLHKKISNKLIPQIHNNDILISAL